jgi:MFS family permease
MTLPQAVGAMITMPLAGRIYDKIGPRIAVVGLFVTGICSLWLQVLDITTPDDTLRWILFFRGMGMGLSMMPIMTYALSSVEQRMTSQASSLLNVCRTLFGSLGIAVFATLLDSFTKTNLAKMIQTVTPGSPVALQELSMIQTYLMQYGFTIDLAHNEAIVLLYEEIYQRAAITAFEMNYVIGAVIVLLGVIPAMFLPFGKFKKGEATVDIGV